MLFSMFSSVSLVLISLLVRLCNAQMQVPINRTFQIGIILDLDSVVGRVGLSSLSLALSDFYSANTNYTTKLQLHVRDSRGQVTDAAAAALDLLKVVQVDAIIGPQKSAQASFINDLGDKAKVPIISFSATSPALHSQTPYFVGAALSDSAQVDAIAALFKHLECRQVVVIYEDSDYGNGIIPYLCNALQNVNCRVSYKSIIPLSATDDFILQELHKMKTMQTRIFLVHVSTSLGSRLFPNVKKAGMMVEGYAWIVTSGLMDLLFSMDPHVIENSMQGVVGVKPLIPRSTRLTSSTATAFWAYDALWALAMAAERIGFREPTNDFNTSVLNFTDLFISTEMSKTGLKLLEAMSEVTFQGVGGKFHLVNRQLEPSSFQILNVVGKGERQVGIWRRADGVLSEIYKLRSIIFPGDSIAAPKGWEVLASGKLRIAVPVEPGFKEFVTIERDPQTLNITKVSGCYIDMFEAVMAALPYVVPYEFVPFEKTNGSSAGSYDELTYQVFLKNYDAAAGDITITSKRSKYVDFTLPFAVGGVNLIVPITYNDLNEKWFFFKPLQKELWLTAVALFFFTGFALWILEHRFNNAYRGPPAHHAGMIFYFPFMSIVYAQRERIVSNLARLVVVVWMFVVLILNSTYTASLSARLTVERLQPAVTDVHQLIKKGDYVGCHEGSFIIELLQKQGFSKSKIRTYKLPEDCDDALSKGSAKGGISAFFAVVPYTKLFLSKYCDKYTTVGPKYTTEGFAYVFPKGSPLVADVSRAVVELRENGRISETERQCSNDPACTKSDDGSTSSSMSLQSFQTLFEITVGITITCLVVFLLTYLYKNKDFVRRISSSSTSFWTKIRAICKHFDQRDPKTLGSSKKTAQQDDGENTFPNNINCSCSSSSVVPISSEEMGDIESSHDLSLTSQTAIAPDQSTPVENTIVIAS